jgi:hypothetical protein
MFSRYQILLSRLLVFHIGYSNMNFSRYFYYSFGKKKENNLFPKITLSTPHTKLPEYLKKKLVWILRKNKTSTDEFFHKYHVQLMNSSCKIPLHFTERNMRTRENRGDRGMWLGMNMV